jgi:hypothetical protein
MTEIVLPGRDDMLARLKSVIDEPHTEKGFYSLLLKHAGTRKDPAGIAMIFTLAIYDYAGQVPAAQMTLNVSLPRFVAALVDDEQARHETLACLQAAQ